MAEYLKLSEVARRLDVSEKTARRYVKSGVLPSIFVGGAYRVSEGDLEDFLEKAKVEPGKAQAPPSRDDLSFNHLLEEERRAQKLEEIRESYREAREGLHHYCARWDKRIADGDLNRQIVREFLLSGSEWFRVLNEALGSEVVELARVLDFHGELDDLRAESGLWPAVDRYLELYQNVSELWQERFAEPRDAAAPVIDFQAKLRERVLDRRAG